MLHTILVLYILCSRASLIDDEECRKRYEQANLNEEYHHADKIIDNIYLGDVCAAHNRTWLQEHNISLVINVAVEWIMIEIQRATDIIHYAFDDSTDLGIMETRRMINNITSRLIEEVSARPHSAILVHCNMGVSRSATVLVRYLQIVYHMNYRTAVIFLKERRPVVRPNSLFKRILINMDL
jgi:predicted protein tyrosine phosphatase